VEENVEVFTSAPSDFNARFQVAALYYFHKDQILFIRRHPNKPEGGTWGLPAGKIEKDEKPINAVLREAFEEVGLLIDRAEAVGILYRMNIRRRDGFPSRKLSNFTLLSGNHKR